MRILADANISRAVVERLRGAGHDVTWASEHAPRAADVEHFATAAREGRTILTEDKDFADLASSATADPPAVILLRLDPIGYAARVARSVEAVGRIGVAEAGRIYTIESSRVRSRRMDQ